MTPIRKSITLLAFTLAALFGFVVLPVTSATLWLVFCVVAFPVWVSFLSSTLEGTVFRPSELLGIYKDSIRTMPSLLKFLKDIVTGSKK
jgi:hypothetical protein